MNFYCTFVRFDLAGFCRSRPSLLPLSQAEDQTAQAHPCPLHQNSGGESLEGLVDEVPQHLPQLKKWLFLERYPQSTILDR